VRGFVSLGNDRVHDLLDFLPSFLPSFSKKSLFPFFFFFGGGEINEIIW